MADQTKKCLFSDKLKREGINISSVVPRELIHKEKLFQLIMAFFETWAKDNGRRNSNCAETLVPYFLEYMIKKNGSLMNISSFANNFCYSLIYWAQCDEEIAFMKTYFFDCSSHIADVEFYLKSRKIIVSRHGKFNLARHENSLSSLKITTEQWLDFATEIFGCDHALINKLKVKLQLSSFSKTPMNKENAIAHISAFDVLKYTFQEVQNYLSVSETLNKEKKSSKSSNNLNSSLQDTKDMTRSTATLEKNLNTKASEDRFSNRNLTPEKSRAVAGEGKQNNNASLERSHLSERPNNLTGELNLSSSTPARKTQSVAPYLSDDSGRKGASKNTSPGRKSIFIDRLQANKSEVSNRAKSASSLAKKHMSKKERAKKIREMQKNFLKFSHLTEKLDHIHEMDKKDVLEIKKNQTENEKYYPVKKDYKVQKFGNEIEASDVFGSAKKKYENSLKPKKNVSKPGTKTAGIDFKSAPPPTQKKTSVWGEQEQQNTNTRKTPEELLKEVENLEKEYENLTKESLEWERLSKFLVDTCDTHLGELEENSNLLYVCEVVVNCVKKNLEGIEKYDSLFQKMDEFFYLDLRKNSKLETNIYKHIRNHMMTIPKDKSKMVKIEDLLSAKKTTAVSFVSSTNPFILMVDELKRKYGKEDFVFKKKKKKGFLEQFKTIIESDFIENKGEAIDVEKYRKKKKITIAKKPANQVFVPEQPAPPPEEEEVLDELDKIVQERFKKKLNHRLSLLFPNHHEENKKVSSVEQVLGIGPGFGRSRKDSQGTDQGSIERTHSPSLKSVLFNQRNSQRNTIKLEETESEDESGSEDEVFN